MKKFLNSYGTYFVGAVGCAVLGWVIFVPSSGGLVTVFSVILFVTVTVFDFHRSRLNSGIVLAVCAASVGLNGLNSQIARHVANEISEEVVNYKSVHGSFPPDLAAVGAQTKATRKWGIRYDVYEPNPILTYPTPWDFFSLWEYDFSAHEWVPVDL